MKNVYLTLLLAITFISNAYAATPKIIEAKGWLESIYATWEPVDGAQSYNIYVSGEGIINCKVDTQLIRQYPSYMRVDIPGLKAGNYVIKIVPVINNTEGDALLTESLQTIAHDRSGFAFNDNQEVGAYNLDGTPKNDAQIIYVSQFNSNTVEAQIDGNLYKGLNAILAAKGKGYDKSPLIVRVVGTIKQSQINDLKDNNYIFLGGFNNTQRMIENITIEGIGEDATLHGFGIGLKRSKNIEIRNLAIMLYGDDAISMDTDNLHIWVHNNDFFYGAPGSDADQAKGDGTIDMKYNSSYITISYNHFWDSGKVMGCGGGTETVPTLYMTFHHNWFDHTDSRNPRLHYTTAHIYNNYYDGVSKYSIGNTTESSAFVESNYFRNSDRPMMISGQGTDAYNSAKDDYSLKGTFSGQDGGMIKAYNNKMVDVEKFVSHIDHPIQYDAYLASTRDEIVPETYKSVRGEWSYNNFDTKSEMYSCIPESPEDAKNKVELYAGRVNSGDFVWEFNNEVDDKDSEVNQALKDLLINYNSNLIAIQGIDKNDSTDSGDGTDTGEGDSSNTGDQIHNFTESNTSSSFYTIIGSTSTSKGTVVYQDMTLTRALKMGSSARVNFTTNEVGKLTLVLSTATTRPLLINNVPYTQDSDGIINANIEPGSYEIKQGSGSGEPALFYIVLKNVATGITTNTSESPIYVQGEIIYNINGERIQIYNMTGVLLAETTNTKFDASCYPAGLYLIRRMSNNNVLKFVIQ